MNVVVIRGNLKEGLDLVSRAVAERAELPVLKNILLEVANNKIKITATNLEIAVTAYVAGKVIEQGSVTVPFGTFSGLITNLLTERVNLESKGPNLTVTTDNYTGTVIGTAVSEFPLIPKIKNAKQSIEISGDILREALVQVLPAAAVSELRPELASILFSYTLDTLTLVATDTFRLAEKKIRKGEFDAHDENLFRILVPLQTAHELIRAIRGKERVTLFRDENQVFCASDSFELISRLLDGTFPDYSAILPKEFSAEVAVQREECLAALKLTSIVGNRNGEVRFRPAKNKKSIDLVSRSEAVGENSYTLPARITGELEDVTFNWRYLADGLRTIKEDEVIIGLNAEKPALLKGVKDASFVYLVAPILGA